MMQTVYAHEQYIDATTALTGLLLARMGPEVPIMTPYSIDFIGGELTAVNIY